jgi:hypothetical protein
MPAFSSPLGVQEVIGERLRVTLGEAECGETRGGLHCSRILPNTWAGSS